MSALDILVVALMFYVLLVIVRGTQAVNLLRGMIVLVMLVVVFSGLSSCARSRGFYAPPCRRCC